MKKRKKEKAEFELSAGGIVYCPQTDEILVIKDPKGRVTFPKGQVQKEENLLETAQRETAEEAGINAEKLVPEGKLGEVKVFYRFQGKLIFKKIVYFLFFSPLQTPSPQKEEINDAFWLPKDEVLEKLDFNNLKPIFKKALKIISRYEQGKTD